MVSCDTQVLRILGVCVRRMYIVYYTGIGCNSNGIHTTNTFLNIAQTVGFYIHGASRFESLIFSVLESGAILYKVVVTDGGLRLDVLELNNGQE
jgi:hypothetical protein